MILASGSGYDEARATAGDHPEMPDFFLKKPYIIYKLRDTLGLDTLGGSPSARDYLTKMASREDCA